MLLYSISNIFDILKNYSISITHLLLYTIAHYASILIFHLLIFDYIPIFNLLLFYYLYSVILMICPYLILTQMTSNPIICSFHILNSISLYYSSHVYYFIN